MSPILQNLSLVTIDMFFLQASEILPSHWLSADHLLICVIFHWKGALWNAMLNITPDILIILTKLYKFAIYRNLLAIDFNRNYVHKR